MKKSFGLLSILLALAFSAGTPLHAQHVAGRYLAGAAGKRVQPPLPGAAPNATYDAGPYLLNAPGLAAGEGQHELSVYCNTCHSPAYVTMQPPLPAATWAAEVGKMQKTFGAEIPDEVVQKIIHYLQSNYTPETRKP